MKTTEEAQRIAIAEACGWKYRPDLNRPFCSRWERWGIVMDVPPPNYLYDLNAMHEAYMSLTREQKVQYVRHLYQVIDAGLEKHPELDEALGLLDVVEVTSELFKATALQCAEAFLRTIGKWVD